MLYSEIIAVCSQIHINTLCGQNVELVYVKLVVHIVTTGLISDVPSLLYRLLPLLTLIGLSRRTRLLRESLVTRSVKRLVYWPQTTRTFLLRLNLVARVQSVITGNLCRAQQQST